MTSALRDLIADSRVHVFDGAMGTMLYSRGVFVNVCYDELNLREPRLVESVHDAYVRAGAEVLETNTFGANPVKLAGYGLAERTEEINEAAARLARRAAAGRAAVAGAVGPLGIRIEPFGPTSRDEARDYFTRQVRGLVAGGVDGFVLETFSDLEEILQALAAARAVADLPVIAQMTVGEDGSTAFGTDAETLARTLTEAGADVLGLNCSVGPAFMLDAIERMAAVTDRPVSAQPNAGLPRAVGDRRIYLSSPEYMASYARRLISAGARFVGGCCGTTPEHVKAIRDVVTTIQPRRTSSAVSRPSSAVPAGLAPVPLADRSRLGGKLTKGAFITTVELAPPKGWNTQQFVEQAEALQAAGVDAVAVLDGPRAVTRMGAVPAAALLRQRAAVEPIVHYACRDRHMFSMVSDLLGAAASGLRNVLIVTGDPPTATLPGTTPPGDIDSIGLTNVVYRLNHGLDPGGNAIGEPTRFVIGVAVNQAADDLEKELSRLGWKVDAGAEFAVTQPVFDPEALAAFLNACTAFRIPCIAGIWPLVSLRNAEFLANEVPGVRVPDHVIARMRKAEERGTEAAEAEGVAIAREMAAAVRGLVQGIQVSAPLGRVDLALRVVAAEETGARGSYPPTASSTAR
jgi:homocysteine S-methyltransferase